MTSNYLLKYKRHLVVTLVTIWAPLAGNAVPEPEVLSEADRIAVEEKLEKIQQLSEDRVSGLYRRAIQDFRSAIQSETATMELYLKCVEKVRFTDEQRKASEFREWKRRNKERLGSSSMRMALRHQLSWLLLSIEAAKRDGDLSEMGSRAITHLNQIFDNAEVLKPHRNVLSQNALGSVFARAYSLNIKVEDWPKSALDIGNIYDKVVLPPLRSVDRIPALRTAWKNRIIHEGQVKEKWSEREESSRIGTKDALRPPDLEKFLAERRPELLWEMQVDCFKAGDEQTSAVQMLTHLETYLTHKNAPEWIEELQKLINPDAVTEEKAPADKDAK